MVLVCFSGANASITDFESNNVAHIAVFNDNVNILRTLIRRCSPPLRAVIDAPRCTDGRTPLSLAADFDMFYGVRELCAAGCDPRSLDFFNRTPLSYNRFCHHIFFPAES